jgi:hypothetical protein
MDENLREMLEPFMPEGVTPTQALAALISDHEMLERLVAENERLRAERDALRREVEVGLASLHKALGSIDARIASARAAAIEECEKREAVRRAELRIDLRAAIVGALGKAAMEARQADREEYADGLYAGITYADQVINALLPPSLLAQPAPAQAEPASEVGGIEEQRIGDVWAPPTTAEWEVDSIDTSSPIPMVHLRQRGVAESWWDLRGLAERGWRRVARAAKEPT